VTHKYQKTNNKTMGVMHPGKEGPTPPSWVKSVMDGFIIRGQLYI